MLISAEGMDCGSFAERPIDFTGERVWLAASCPAVHLAHDVRIYKKRIHDKTGLVRRAELCAYAYKRSKIRDIARDYHGWNRPAFGRIDPRIQKTAPAPGAVTVRGKIQSA